MCNPLRLVSFTQIMPFFFLMENFICARLRVITREQHLSSENHSQHNAFYIHPSCCVYQYFVFVAG